MTNRKFIISVFNNVLALLMSTMMVLPAPLASAKQTETAAVEDKEVLPVAIIPTAVGSESHEMWVIPVPGYAAVPIIETVADQSPNAVTLAVSGPKDPFLKRVGSRLGKIKTFIFGEADELTPTPVEQSAAMPKGIRDRLAKVTTALKNKYYNARTGLMIAIFAASSMQARAVYYSTESVGAPAAVLAGTFLVSMILANNGALYERIANGTGDKISAAVNAVGKLFGYELTETGKRLYQTVGFFTFTAAVAAATSLWITSWAGATLSYTGLGWIDIFKNFLFTSEFWRSLAEAGANGLANNLNIWAAIPLAMHKAGTLSKKGLQKYFIAEALVLGVAETAVNNGVPLSGLFGTVGGIAGLLYVAFNPSLREIYHQRFSRVFAAFNPKKQKYRGVAFLKDLSKLSRFKAGAFSKPSIHERCLNALTGAEDTNDLQGLITMGYDYK